MYAVPVWWDRLSERLVEDDPEHDERPRAYTRGPTELMPTRGRQRSPLRLLAAANSRRRERASLAEQRQEGPPGVTCLRVAVTLGFVGPLA